MFRLISLLSASIAAASLLPSASDLEVQIRANGAQATVRKLWATSPEWDILLRRIESGDSAWVKVAVALKPGSDAGSAETLKQAVSLSIQKAPEQFLSIAWPAFGQEACHDLQIEPSPQQHVQFMDATRKALSSVSDDTLTSRRDACLEALQGNRRLGKL